ncbi:gastrin/cholecystokinin type B receptor isoform X3 [Cryptotermes secundus]|uniref:gastrin/cholecystokinin type B receptor isoform X3 n=1 Tax=Cryptotermes secundus TaxID=105785 RepID=UPI001454D8F8|nr:gastrin/cholecystokinin type B receptor isoform X3 [Cryptotermes secundus]
MAQELTDILRLQNSNDWANLSSFIRLRLNENDLSDLIDYPSLDMVEPPVKTALVWIYSLTAALSVAGNVTVIVVLSFGKRSSGDLRAFLINLAVSDVTMAIFSIPFTYTMFMLGRWIFHPLFCSVVIAMQHISVVVSVYTLTAIGIDRWHWECGEQWSSIEDGQTYTMLIFSVTFAVPLLSLAFTYTCVGRRLWLRASPGNADPTRDLTQLRAKRKIIKMLVTIVVLFALCWLPLQTFLLLYYFVPGFDSYQTDEERKVYALSYFACHWLANANSMVNPFVYCFMSDNFRADLRDLLTPRARNSRDSIRSASTRTTISQFQRCGSGSIATRQWNTGSANVVMKDYKPTYTFNCQQDSTSQL